RTGARDALLSDEATPASKGAVFGFHRSMDTLGAAVGPVIALLFLYFYPGEYVILFYLAFLPGLVSVLITLVLKEKPRIDRPSPKGDGFFGFLTYVSRSNRQYKMLLTGLLLFALFNSSDIFLLLIVKHHGYSDTEMVGLYIFYNLVFALFSYPLGTLADKIGLKKMFIAGLIIFAITYSGIALSSERLILLLLFFFYGIYAACTEGVSKAWISNICDRSDTGTAIGTYEGLRSITTFFSSTIAGVIWIYFNPETMFLATAIAVLGIVLFFLKIPYAESTILNDS
ncbi:MAG: MFS transporter, partial [Saprospiraceae bacterium]|nr:MFS transporter [Saprospiraceae bacterium]